MAEGGGGGGDAQKKTWLQKVLDKRFYCLPGHDIKGNPKPSESGIIGDNFPQMRDLPQTLDLIERWLRFSPATKYSNRLSEEHKVCRDAWHDVHLLFGHHYWKLLDHLPRVLTMIRLHESMLMNWNEIQGGKMARLKTDVDHTHIHAAIFEVVLSILGSVSMAFHTFGFNQEHYDTFKSGLEHLVHICYAEIPEVDPLVACAKLDALAVIQKDIFIQLPERYQRGMIVSLLAYGKDGRLSAQTRSKVGRCLAKLIEFPSLQDDVTFFMDVFDLTKFSLDVGENAVKMTYSWTFGNLTDIMLQSEMASAENIGRREFVKMLLETAVLCINVPTKGRYNACRAWGNIFQWIKYSMVEAPDLREKIVNIAKALNKMVGVGQDYKLRWNAAWALGQAFESDASKALGAMEGTIVVNLSMWSYRSQNYKERTQCLIALQKIKEREIFGTSKDFAGTLERIGLALHQLPADEIGEEAYQAEKFKTEGILLFTHLVSLMEREDIVPAQPFIAAFSDPLKQVFEELVPKIPLNRLDIAFKCQDKLTLLRTLTIESEDEYYWVSKLNLIFAHLWKAITDD